VNPPEVKGKKRYNIKRKARVLSNGCKKGMKQQFLKDLCSAAEVPL
jgi:hypothetical protein